MPVLLQRLWIQLTADRKRFAVLCSALGVGLLLWARIIVISGGNVPRAAVADKPLAGSESSRLDGLVSGEGRAAPVRAVRLDEQPHRDPFVISARHFPKPPDETDLRLSVPDQGKSSAQAAEDAEEAKARQIAVLLNLASRFRLEAVMHSGGADGVPMAVINGRTRRLGETVPAVGNEEIGYELVEVRHRSVMLRFEEHFFEVRMTTPGQ